jgi:hypothetical protein
LLEVAKANQGCRSDDDDEEAKKYHSGVFFSVHVEEC